MCQKPCAAQGGGWDKGCGLHGSSFLVPGSSLLSFDIRSSLFDILRFSTTTCAYDAGFQTSPPPEGWPQAGVGARKDYGGDGAPPSTSCSTTEKRGEPRRPKLASFAHSSHTVWSRQPHLTGLKRRSCRTLMREPGMAGKPSNESARLPRSPLRIGGGFAA